MMCVTPAHFETGTSTVPMGASNSPSGAAAGLCAENQQGIQDRETLKRGSQRPRIDAR